MSDTNKSNIFLRAGGYVGAAFLGAGAFALLQTVLPGVGSRAEMEGIVRSYILENPEILPEAIEKLREGEAKKAQAAAEDAQKAVPAMQPVLEKAYPGAVAGNANGDVTVVAFMDYACGYCRASVPVLEELIAKDPNIRVVYREFPVLGPESGLAARWGLAAAEQGKFMAFHNALYAGGSPSAETIRAAAAQAGLDQAVAAKAVESKPVTEELQNNHALAQKLAINGTPSWVVGGKLIHGAVEYATLAAAVADARKAK